MLTVYFRGREIKCDRGGVLRDMPRVAGESSHSGHSSWFSCRSGGPCDTCAVRVCGSAACRTKKERRRLRFPLYDPDSGLRLVCQTVVLGDLRVEKYPGFWGQCVEVDESETGAVQDAEDTQEPTD